jgi:hypothetical protein
MYEIILRKGSVGPEGLEEERVRCTEEVEEHIRLFKTNF